MFIYLSYKSSNRSFFVFVVFFFHYHSQSTIVKALPKDQECDYYQNNNPI